MQIHHKYLILLRKYGIQNVLNEMFISKFAWIYQFLKYIYFQFSNIFEHFSPFCFDHVCKVGHYVRVLGCGPGPVMTYTTFYTFLLSIIEF